MTFAFSLQSMNAEGGASDCENLCALEEHRESLRDKLKRCPAFHLLAVVSTPTEIPTHPE